MLNGVLKLSVTLLSAIHLRDAGRIIFCCFFESIYFHHAFSMYNVVLCKFSFLNACCGLRKLWHPTAAVDEEVA